MPNAYIEIHKTYWRRLFSSWIGIVWIIGGIGFLGGSLTLRGKHAFSPGIGPINFFVMGICFTNWMLWGHFRELVVNQGRVFFPCGARANVVVFAGFAMLVAILWPAVLRPTLVLALPVMAFAVAWFALAGWVALMGSPVLFMVGFGLYFWFGFFTFAPFDGMVLSFLQGNDPLATGVLAVIAAVATALAMAGMVRLSADDPRYGRTYHMGPWASRPRIMGESNQVWKQQSRMDMGAWFAGRRDVYIPLVDSLWEGAKRWRRLHRGAMQFAMFFVAITIIVPLATMRGATGYSPALLIQAGVLSFLMPPMYVMQSWMQQWRYLEIETLRPIVRQRFLAEAALAIAIDLVQCWAIFLMAPIILSLAFPGDSLSAEFFGLATASLIFNYTLVIWMLRWRSSNGTAGIMLITMLEIPLPVGLGLTHHYQWLAWPAVALFLLGALFLWRAAQQRWLVAELG